MVMRSSSPAVRYPDPLPPAPERSGGETQALAEGQRSSFFRRSGGRAMTMLTGGRGTEGGMGVAKFLGEAART